MRKILVAVLIIIASTGCASQMVWYQEGKSFTEAENDFHDCKYDAVKYGYVPIQYNAYSAPGASGLAAGLEEGLRQNEIMKECMKSKGYRLVPRRNLEQMGVQIGK